MIKRLVLPFVLISGIATLAFTQTQPSPTQLARLLAAANNWTALQRFSSGISSDGVHASTIPAVTDTLVGKATTDTLSNKTFDTSAPNTLKIGGVDVSTALTSYSPGVASTVGTITTKSATGKYKQVGKMVFVQIRISITTNGTGSGSIQVDLPVASNASVYTQSGRATGVSGKQIQGITVSGAATLAIFNYDNTYPGADGEVIVISGWYETT